MKKINQFSILLIACLTASMTSYAQFKIMVSLLYMINYPIAI